jgi:tRNA nucleotidyltransferase (CCA-adding enzyme)
VPTEIRRFVRSLDIDAYVVGGAVRDELLGIPHADEDFLVPGVDHATLRRLLEPHGRVEDMVVHGQLVGVRLHPRDRALRALVPSGIELTPPRIERSTGPRHRDFEIVADPSITVEQDMARRDFTVNAMARRLADGALLDPFGGLHDLEARELRTVTAHSFVEDPLRILRGLRLVSQLGFTLADDTVDQMRTHAAGLQHVSGEHDPTTALRLARDTGVLVAILPELAECIGYASRSERQRDTLDEHLIAVVGETATLGAPLEVRLAALVHDVGKPAAERGGGRHAELSARSAAAILTRLRYPTAFRRRVRAIVAAHAFAVEPWIGTTDDGRATRRFLAAHGDELARSLAVHKLCDLRSKGIGGAEVAAVERLLREVDEQASRPHRIADLAVSGDDVLAAGVPPGPSVGAVLHALLARVVEDPSLNRRDVLLALVGEVRP